MQKWSAMLVMVWVQHLRDRYGDAAVGTWLWEVWNEPDIEYWHGSPEEYDKLYDVTAAAIRVALPGAKIGGPEATGVGPGKSEQMLASVSGALVRWGRNAATGKIGAPLDFISFHPKGAPKTVNGHVQMDLGHQLRAMDFGMKVVASYPRVEERADYSGRERPGGLRGVQGAAEWLSQWAAVWGECGGGDGSVGGAGAAEWGEGAGSGDLGAGV